MPNEWDKPAGGDLAATYGDAFFGELEEAVRSSASVVVPLVCRALEPRSVLDVGCGRGAWLRAFLDEGVTEVLGVDGSHIDPETLLVPRAAFLARDLRQPIQLDHRFDLVVSLEVGEHLEPDLAVAFVRSLAGHASQVLFSAAIPYQSGPGHVNEAWQSTWATLFAEHGFVPLDVIRPVVWNDDRVAYWYAQNIVLYVHRPLVDCVSRRFPLTAPMLDVVHPGLYMRMNSARHTPVTPSLRRLLRELPAATRRAFTHRVDRRNPMRES
jgi:SAM-dependent methyltransferase